MKVVKDQITVVRKADGYNVFRGNGEYLSGAVRTVHGFVKVFADSKYLNMSLIIQGHEATRTVRGRKYTKRGIVLLARRFADEYAP